jgi:hypothetical protein
MLLDLFEHYHLLPPEINAILDEFYEGEQDYKTCKALKVRLKAQGYTFDYGLDAQPHSLRKLEH